MEYRQLGDCGLKVSPICLGAMMFGSASDDKTAGRIVDSARKHGVNFIDITDGYSGGNSGKSRAASKERSQELGCRDEDRQSPAPSSFDTRLGKGHMTTGIDESLNRLQTDWVDIWHLHKEDLVPPLAETVATMGDVIA